MRLCHFFSNYGAGSIGAEEIYGLIDENFADACLPDGIWFTLTERSQIQIPKNLYVLCDTGADEFICLDFNRCDKVGEPSVVTCSPGFDNSIQTYKKIADDFGDYLLAIVL